MTKREHENRVRTLDRLRDLGFTYDEAESLRRIEMTLQRWGELECGNSDNYKSWHVERDEETGKPSMRIIPHTGDARGHSYPIPDREKGALKRGNAIVNARNKRKTPSQSRVVFYHQGDPRGCAVYIVPASELEAGNPDSIHSLYTRGIAVCS